MLTDTQEGSRAMASCPRGRSLVQCSADFGSRKEDGV
jgi:hypothetical protein